VGAIALVHCSADGTAVAPALDPDAGPALNDASPADDGGGTPDGFSPPGDAGQCSADRWCQTPLPGNFQLTAVWSFAANDALAATTSSLLHWDGNVWTPVDAPVAEGVTRMWSPSPTDIWGIGKGQTRLVHGHRASPNEPFAWSAVDYDPATSPT